ncbi:hypothetical protein [Novosphingobium resinovorum]|uniref:Uncharacterized protein n=1 Tax=Novosphingobium resinovorum TaxID=158500 RepID=A0A1D8A326_9SPHN|nr:hypothetical protein [Novosphingobium resinovorum]AOR76525.1 hypothetical protein BES08_07045 [Novosphingobium resinovorum]
MNVVVNLPFFPGFYCSSLSGALDHAETMEAENSAEKEESAEYYPETYQPEELRLSAADYQKILFDCMDYGGAHRSMAADYVAAFDQWATENLETPAGTFTFESMDSPREYNFRTDRVYATVPLAAMESLYRSLDLEKLAAVIAERHSSRSGFISFYPDDVDEWQGKEFAEFDHNEMGTILCAAIASREAENPDETCCYAVDESSYEYVDKWCDWQKFESAVREKRAEKLAAWIDADSDAAARYVAHHAETLTVLELALAELDTETRTAWEASAGIIAARFYRCPFTPDMFPEAR